MLKVMQDIWKQKHENIFHFVLEDWFGNTWVAIGFCVGFNYLIYFMSDIYNKVYDNV